MSTDRAGIIANAKYLRNVRPIDPEEICEYVEGGADPRVVRQILREEAVDLGLVERDDGTFVPVTEEPVHSGLNGVAELPETYARVVGDLLLSRFGRDWHAGESGDRLRSVIRKLKERYYRQHPVEYDYDAALGYAVYHLPDYYAVGQYVFADLAADGLLSTDLRVLDVGAGVGGPALGLHDLLPDDALVDYHAVEPSEATEVLEALLAETSRNFHTTVHDATAEDFEPAGEFDLVVFGNVLSELDSPADVVERYLDSLAADGTLVAVAPADRNTSIELREVEREVERRGATVYGPTVRLWPDEQPSDRGWSFDERPDVEAPGFQARLADAAERPSEFYNTSVKFSYTFLRVDGRQRYDVDLSGGRVAKLADLEEYVTDRADATVAKLSRDLAEGKGANPLFKISDGSESTGCYAVLVRETATNADLVSADYGDLLSLERALVLWNDDESAYNLVVDEETMVDLVR